MRTKPPPDAGGKADPYPILLAFPGAAEAALYQSQPRLRK
jgi:hypothetical protein